MKMWGPPITNYEEFQVGDGRALNPEQGPSARGALGGRADHTPRKPALVALSLCCYRAVCLSCPFSGPQFLQL